MAKAIRRNSNGKKVAYFFLGMLVSFLLLIGAVAGAGVWCWYSLTINKLEDFGGFEIPYIRDDDDPDSLKNLPVSDLVALVGDLAGDIRTLSAQEVFDRLNLELPIDDLGGVDATGLWENLMMADLLDIGTDIGSATNRQELAELLQAILDVPAIQTVLDYFTLADLETWMGGPLPELGFLQGTPDLDQNGELQYDDEGNIIQKSKEESSLYDVLSVVVKMVDLNTLSIGYIEDYIFVGQLNDIEVAREIMAMLSDIRDVSFQQMLDDPNANIFSLIKLGTILDSSLLDFIPGADDDRTDPDWATTTIRGYYNDISIQDIFDDWRVLIRIPIGAILSDVNRIDGVDYAIPQDLVDAWLENGVSFDDLIFNTVETLDRVDVNDIVSVVEIFLPESVDEITAVFEDVSIGGIIDNATEELKKINVGKFLTAVNAILAETGAGENIIPQSAIDAVSEVTVGGLIEDPAAELDHIYISDLLQIINEILDEPLNGEGFDLMFSDTLGSSEGGQLSLGALIEDYQAALDHVYLANFFEGLDMLLEDVTPEPIFTQQVLDLFGSDTVGMILDDPVQYLKDLGVWELLRVARSYLEEVLPDDLVATLTSEEFKKEVRDIVGDRSIGDFLDGYYKEVYVSDILDLVNCFVEIPVSVYTLVGDSTNDGIQIGDFFEFNQLLNKLYIANVLNAVNELIGEPVNGEGFDLMFSDTLGSAEGGQLSLGALIDDPRGALNNVYVANIFQGVDKLLEGKVEEPIFTQQVLDLFGSDTVGGIIDDPVEYLKSLGVWELARVARSYLEEALPDDIAEVLTSEEFKKEVRDIVGDKTIGELIDSYKEIYVSDILDLVDCFTELPNSVFLAIEGIQIGDFFNLEDLLRSLKLANLALAVNDLCGSPLEADGLTQLFQDVSVGGFVYSVEEELDNWDVGGILQGLDTILAPFVDYYYIFTPEVIDQFTGTSVWALIQDPSAEVLSITVAEVFDMLNSYFDEDLISVDYLPQTLAQKTLDEMLDAPVGFAAVALAAGTWLWLGEEAPASLPALLDDIDYALILEDPVAALTDIKVSSVLMVADDILDVAADLGWVLTDELIAVFDFSLADAIEPDTYLNLRLVSLIDAVFSYIDAEGVELKENTRALLGEAVVQDLWNVDFYLDLNIHNLIDSVNEYADGIITDSVKSLFTPDERIRDFIDEEEWRSMQIIEVIEVINSYCDPDVIDADKLPELLRTLTVGEIIDQPVWLAWVAGGVGLYFGFDEVPTAYVNIGESFMDGLEGGDAVDGLLNIRVNDLLSLTDFVTDRLLDQTYCDGLYDLFESNGEALTIGTLIEGEISLLGVVKTVDYYTTEYAGFSIYKTELDAVLGGLTFANLTTEWKNIYVRDILVAVKAYLDDYVSSDIVVDEWTGLFGDATLGSLDQALDQITVNALLDVLYAYLPNYDHRAFLDADALAYIQRLTIQDIIDLPERGLLALLIAEVSAMPAEGVEIANKFFAEIDFELYYNDPTAALRPVRLALYAEVLGDLLALTIDYNFGPGLAAMVGDLTFGDLEETDYILDKFYVGNILKGVDLIAAEFTDYWICTEQLCDLFADVTLYDIIFDTQAVLESIYVADVVPVINSYFDQPVLALEDLPEDMRDLSVWEIVTSPMYLGMIAGGVVLIAVFDEIPAPIMDIAETVAGEEEITDGLLAIELSDLIALADYMTNFFLEGEIYSTPELYEAVEGKTIRSLTEGDLVIAAVLKAVDSYTYKYFDFTFYSDEIDNLFGESTFATVVDDLPDYRLADVVTLIQLYVNNYFGEGTLVDEVAALFGGTTFGTLNTFFDEASIGDMLDIFFAYLPGWDNRAQVPAEAMAYTESVTVFDILENPARLIILPLTILSSVTLSDYEPYQIPADIAEFLEGIDYRAYHEDPVSQLRGVKLSVLTGFAADLIFNLTGFDFKAAFARMVGDVTVDVFATPELVADSFYVDNVLKGIDMIGEEMGLGFYLVTDEVCALFEDVTFYDLIMLPDVVLESITVAEIVDAVNSYFDQPVMSVSDLPEKLQNCTAWDLVNEPVYLAVTGGVVAMMILFDQVPAPAKNIIDTIMAEDDPLEGVYNVSMADVLDMIDFVIDYYFTSDDYTTAALEELLDDLQVRDVLNLDLRITGILKAADSYVDLFTGYTFYKAELEGIFGDSTLATILDDYPDITVGSIIAAAEAYLKEYVDADLDLAALADLFGDATIGSFVDDCYDLEISRILETVKSYVDDYVGTGYIQQALCDVFAGLTVGNFVDNYGDITVGSLISAAEAYLNEFVDADLDLAALADLFGNATIGSFVDDCYDLEISAILETVKSYVDDYVGTGYIQQALCDVFAGLTVGNFAEEYGTITVGSIIAAAEAYLNEFATEDLDLTALADLFGNATIGNFVDDCYDLEIRAILETVKTYVDEYVGTGYIQQALCDVFAGLTVGNFAEEYGTITVGSIIAAAEAYLNEFATEDLDLTALADLFGNATIGNFVDDCYDLEIRAILETVKTYVDEYVGTGYIQQALCDVFGTLTVGSIADDYGDIYVADILEAVRAYVNWITGEDTVIAEIPALFGEATIGSLEETLDDIYVDAVLDVVFAYLPDYDNRANLPAETRTYISETLSIGSIVEDPLRALILPVVAAGALNVDLWLKDSIDSILVPIDYAAYHDDPVSQLIGLPLSTMTDILGEVVYNLTDSQYDLRPGLATMVGDITIEEATELEYLLDSFYIANLLEGGQQIAEEFVDFTAITPEVCALFGDYTLYDLVYETEAMLSGIYVADVIPAVNSYFEEPVLALEDLPEDMRDLSVWEIVTTPLYLGMVGAGVALIVVFGEVPAPIMDIAETVTGEEEIIDGILAIDLGDVLALADYMTNEFLKETYTTAELYDALDGRTIRDLTEGEIVIAAVLKAVESYTDKYADLTFYLPELDEVLGEMTFASAADDLADITVAALLNAVGAYLDEYVGENYVLASLPALFGEMTLGQIGDEDEGILSLSVNGIIGVVRDYAAEYASAEYVVEELTTLFPADMTLGNAPDKLEETGISNILAVVKAYADMADDRIVQQSVVDLFEGMTVGSIAERWLDITIPDILAVVRDYTNEFAGGDYVKDSLVELFKDKDGSEMTLGNIDTEYRNILVASVLDVVADYVNGYVQDDLIRPQIPDLFGETTLGTLDELPDNIVVYNMLAAVYAYLPDYDNMDALDQNTLAYIEGLSVQDILDSPLRAIILPLVVLNATDLSDLMGEVDLTESLNAMLSEVDYAAYDEDPLAEMMKFRLSAVTDVAADVVNGLTGYDFKQGLRTILGSAEGELAVLDPVTIEQLTEPEYLLDCFYLTNLLLGAQQIAAEFTDFTVFTDEVCALFLTGERGYTLYDLVFETENMLSSIYIRDLVPAINSYFEEEMITVDALGEIADESVWSFITNPTYMTLVGVAAAGALTVWITFGEFPQPLLDIFDQVGADGPLGIQIRSVFEFVNAFCDRFGAEDLIKPEVFTFVGEVTLGESYQEEGLSFFTVGNFFGALLSYLPEEYTVNYANLLPEADSYLDELSFYDVAGDPFESLLILPALGVMFDSEQALTGEINDLYASADLTTADLAALDRLNAVRLAAVANLLTGAVEIVLDDELPEYKQAFELIFNTMDVEELRDPNVWADCFYPADIMEAVDLILGRYEIEGVFTDELEALFADVTCYDVVFEWESWLDGITVESFLAAANSYAAYIGEGDPVLTIDQLPAVYGELSVYDVATDVYNAVGFGVCLASNLVFGEVPAGLVGIAGTLAAEGDVMAVRIDDVLSLADFITVHFELGSYVTDEVYLLFEGLSVEDVYYLDLNVRDLLAAVDSYFEEYLDYNFYKSEYDLLFAEDTLLSSYILNELYLEHRIADLVGLAKAYLDDVNEGILVSEWSELFGDLTLQATLDDLLSTVTAGGLLNVALGYFPDYDNRANVDADALAYAEGLTLASIADYPLCTAVLPLIAAAAFDGDLRLTDELNAVFADIDFSKYDLDVADGLLDIRVQHATDLIVSAIELADVDLSAWREALNTVFYASLTLEDLTRFDELADTFYIRDVLTAAQIIADEYEFTLVTDELIALFGEETFYSAIFDYDIFLTGITVEEVLNAVNSYLPEDEPLVDPAMLPEAIREHTVYGFVEDPAMLVFAAAGAAMYIVYGEIPAALDNMVQSFGEGADFVDGFLNINLTDVFDLISFFLDAYDYRVLPESLNEAFTVGGTPMIIGDLADTAVLRELEVAKLLTAAQEVALDLFEIEVQLPDNLTGSDLTLGDLIDTPVLAAAVLGTAALSAYYQSDMPESVSALLGKLNYVDVIDAVDVVRGVALDDLMQAVLEITGAENPLPENIYAQIGALDLYNVLVYPEDLLDVITVGAVLADFDTDNVVPEDVVAVIGSLSLYRLVTDPVDALADLSLGDLVQFEQVPDWIRTILTRDALKDITLYEIINDAPLAFAEVTFRDLLEGIDQIPVSLINYLGDVHVGPAFEEDNTAFINTIKNQPIGPLLEAVQMNENLKAELYRVTLAEIQNDPIGAIGHIKLGTLLDVFESDGTTIQEGTQGFLRAIANITISDLTGGEDILSKVEGTIGDLLDITEDDPAVLQAIGKLEISTLKEEFPKLLVGDILGVIVSKTDTDGDGVYDEFVYEEGTSDVIRAIAHIQIGNLTEELPTLRVGDLLGVYDDQGNLIGGTANVVKAIAHIQIGNLADELPEVKMGDLLGIYDENGGLIPGTHAALAAIADLTITQLSDSTLLVQRINTLTLGDLIEIKEETSPKILVTLADTPLGELGTAIKDLKINQVLDLPTTGILSVIDGEAKITELDSVIETALTNGSVTVGKLLETMYTPEEIEAMGYSENVLNATLKTLMDRLTGGTLTITNGIDTREVTYLEYIISYIDDGWVPSITNP